MQIRNSLKSSIKNENRLFFVLMFFYSIEYIRPFDNYLSFLSSFKIAGLTGLFLFFVFVSKPKGYLKQPIIRGILAFNLLMTIMVPLAVNNHWAFHTTKEMWWMTFSVLCPTLYLLNSNIRIISFFKIWIFIQLFLCLVVISQGGRGPGSYLRDENDVACAIAMFMPLVFFMLYSPDIKKSLKWVYIGILLIMLAAIVTTSSRGGFLGLIACLLAIWWLCKSRVRNLCIILISSLIIGNLVLALMPDGYVEDMQSINDKDDNTRKKRLLHWQTAWEMYKANPIAGVGPYNYPWNHSKYVHLAPLDAEIRNNLSGRQSHSLYFTLIPELGTIGVIIFIFIIWKATFTCFRIIRETTDVDDNDARYFHLFAKSLVAGLFSYLISAVFISVLYYPLMWHLVTFIVALSIVWEKKKKELNPKLSIRGLRREYKHTR